MTMIYDLDNEYGMRIIGDSGVDGAVMQIDSNAAGGIVGGAKFV